MTAPQHGLFDAPPESTVTPPPAARAKPTTELRLGRWQDALADLTEVDALISDPPYSARTHENQRHGRRDEMCAGEYVSARGLNYGALEPDDVREFVHSWAPRVRGWFCVMTDSELYTVWRDALEAEDRTVFAPLPCVMRGMNVRLAGDGPSSWCVWLVVARPRSLSKWGTLRGAYVGNPFDPGENTATAGRRSSVVGSKPHWLMSSIIRDYTRRGDRIVDPCCGGGTTLLAARRDGRSSIGAEVLPAHHAIAAQRLANSYTPELFEAE